MFDFPNNPTLNQEHTVGDRTWAWNGQFWVRLSPFQQNLATIAAVVPQDGDILEFSSVDNAWTATNNVRKLMIDGGNF